ncbi:MAG: tetratricopeptide repeat protein [Bacteroidia bacterium]|nr:tetratricopeptide repeat protein [Bacteroidia bacterium]
MEHEEQLIAEYLAGELDAQAAAAFERRLTTEPALAASVREQRLAISVLQADSRARQKEALRALVQDTPIRPMWQPQPWMAVAAAVVLLWSVWLVWPRQTQGNTQELALAYLEPYPLPIARGDSSSQLSPAVVSLYQQGRYAEAADSLRLRYAADSGQVFIALCLADAYSLSGNFDAALRVLEALPPQPDLQDVIDWRRALNVSLTGPPDAARPLLRSISQSPTHYRRTQATTLLQTLGD